MYAHVHEANQFEYALKIITVLSTVCSIKEQGDVHAYYISYRAHVHVCSYRQINYMYLNMH